MKIGTKSILFGAHQFLLHPLFVALAWWKLFGFPWDPRLWVAFYVHDLGYWGKPNMDGPEGEDHPRAGANIMGVLFDWHFMVAFKSRTQDARGNHYRYRDLIFVRTAGCWHDFTLFHSRYMARKLGKPFSRLCVADKLATVLVPTWLYLLLTNLSGEIHEYMDVAHHREGGKYAHEIRVLGSQREWFESMCTYMRKWIDEHRDGRTDTWTPPAANSDL